MPETSRVKQDIESLKQVQVLDKEIYDLSQELLHIPEALKAAEEEFNRAKKASELVEDSLKQARLKQKEKELELGQKEQDILKLQGQLGQVKTNKEYSAIQLEIASKKADNSVLEEAIILLMDEVEAASKNVSASKESLKQDEKKLNDKKSELKQKEQTFQQKIEELKSKRKESMTQVNPEVFAFYEKILAKKNGVALSRIEDETCSSCRMRLRPQVQNEVKLQESIVVCENCSRILYEES